MGKTKKQKPRGNQSTRVDRSSQQTTDWSGASPWWILAAAIVLVLAAMVVYNDTTGRLFFDDLSAIEGNPHVHALANPATRWQWDTWKKAAWAPIDNPLAGRPVVAFSFALNHWWAYALHPSEITNFYGVTPRHTPYFHYVNLFLHILVTLSVFALVRQTLLTPVFKGRFRNTATAWSFAAALLWSLHPLNTETVVYVTQRTELILSLFFVLTFVCWNVAQNTTSRDVRICAEIAAVVCCALGMASKENMVAAPLLLILYDRAFRYETWKETFRIRGRFYVGIFSTYIVFIMLNGGATPLGRIPVIGPMMGHPRGESVGFQHDKMTALEYLITQTWCLWRYVWLSLIPIQSKLCVDYGRRVVLDFWNTAPGALMILSFMGLTIWGWIKKPWVGFLGTWFFFILAPTSSFYPIVTEVGAERRMYLPLLAVMVGAAVVVVWLYERVMEEFLDDDGVLSASLSVSGWAALLGLTIFFGVSSHERTKAYGQDATAYGHINDVFPENDRGCNNFAKICIDMGDKKRGRDLLNHAVYIDPEYSDAFTNRAIIFHQERRFDVAIANSTEAVKWNPYNVSAWNNRGNAFMELKDYQSALADFTKVIDITRNPETGKGSPDGYFGRANVYFLMGEEDPKNYDLAMDDVNSALAVNPDDYKALNTMGNILKKLKKPEEAVKAFDRALDAIRKEAGHYPTYTDMYKSWLQVQTMLDTVDLENNSVARETFKWGSAYPQRGTIAAILGNRADAYNEIFKITGRAADERKVLDDISRAIVFDPNNPQYWFVRAQFHKKNNRPGEAMFDLEQVLRVAPNAADAITEHLRMSYVGAQYEKAAEDVAKLIQLNTPVDATIHAGLVEKFLGDFRRLYDDGLNSTDVQDRTRKFEEALKQVAIYQQLQSPTTPPDVAEKVKNIYAISLRTAYEQRRFADAKMLVERLHQLGASIDADIAAGLQQAGVIAPNP